MAIRKLDLMRRVFGVTDGHTCRECSNFIKGRYHDKVLCKCKVYGLTHSEATDWAGRWQACGAFNQTVNRKPIVREVIPERKRQKTDNTPLDGQISLLVWRADNGKSKLD